MQHQIGHIEVHSMPAENAGGVPWLVEPRPATEASVAYGQSAKIMRAAVALPGATGRLARPTATPADLREARRALLEQVDALAQVLAVYRAMVAAIDPDRDA